MPNCVQQIFGNTSTVPLLEVLQFCTSEMTITTNPIPVTCTNCYRNIWIYYLFKKKCMYKEKAIEEEYNPGSYGNFVGCRACSTTNYTNVISLNENTELGRLLNSMFTKYYPSSFVPLGLCPSCESTLKEIQVFRRVLSLANQYFEQHQENLLHSQVSQDKPVVALKELDTAQKQIILSKLMVETGLRLKDKSSKPTEQNMVWNGIQKSFIQRGCNISIQNLKDLWSALILDYTLGRLKGTELDDIISEYLKAEPPTPTNKPLKKRYRSPLSTSASTSRDPVIQHILTGDVIPIRRHPEPMGIFEPNMIPPPSYNSIVPPPPYSLSTMCGSSTSTATCSAFDAKTGVRSTVENRAAAQEYQYQASYSGILSNQDHLKLEKVAGNVRKAPINTIPVIQSAILKSSMIIDLTEEEDKMVQVANISSSWEDQSPEGAGAHIEPDSETAKGNSVHAGGSTVNSVGKEASSSQMEMSDTGPGKQTSLKNEVDREHKNASHNWWTREKDMIFLDALTAQFKQANARSLIQIWRNLKNENLLSSKKATTLASHWYDLKKNYNKKSLDRGLSEKVSHCMKLFDQLDAIKNSVRASKQPDDENSVILVRKMTNFLHESDIFDVTWNVVLRKMSSCDKFAGYNYLNLKVQWQNLFRRLKTRTGGTALSNDLKEELDSLMGLMKKLKLRNYWHTELAPKKAESPWFGSKKKRRAMSKNVGKPQQCFSFQDKVDLLEAMKNEYEVSRSKATLAANPWRTLIIKVKSHRTKYDTWDESRLLRMWSQMKVSAKIHVKDGSDYVDMEVWNLLETHNKYLKNRKNDKRNSENLIPSSPEKKTEKQNDKEEKSEKGDNKAQKMSTPIKSPSKTPEAGTPVTTPTEKVQTVTASYTPTKRARTLISSCPSPKKIHTLISSFCKVEKPDLSTKVESSSSCDPMPEQNEEKPSCSKVPVRVDDKTFEASSEILTIVIDSDSEFSEGNDDASDSKVTPPASSSVKAWTESEKNAFFKAVKLEFGTMLKNDENISNPWKTILKRLHESEYSMYSLKELDKVWRKIRMDAHLHENNNSLFVTPLDTEMNRLIKLLHTVKRSKKMNKLAEAKFHTKQEDADPKIPKTPSPENKKRKKGFHSIAKAKKDKKQKLALPPLDPNRIEEDQEAAESTPWSDKEQLDLISTVVTTGNEVFKPDNPKQYWNTVRMKLFENGHRERSLGALYYNWNRLLESAKRAWADQKVMNHFDKVVIEFLREVIMKKNDEKTYNPENGEKKQAPTNNLPENNTKNKQQSEPHSVNQNNSDKGKICDGSSAINENKDEEECDIAENRQESENKDDKTGVDDDTGDSSEDEYVSAADIMRMV